MITKLAFVAHPTRDLAKSKLFYGELLGLPQSAEYAECWAEFTTPDGKTVALDTFSPKFRCPDNSPGCALRHVG